ncbi:GEVED domain-containing protein [Winogradskyella eximia]|uniref:GEVED domain-containing protein n=1 Tax=Winogradskyella eximia TaxID=262006 RepID=UPI00248F71CF|nr:GEVED domain-containing protein [Winogradskyella eximia]
MLKKILFAFAITFSIVISAQTLIIDPAGDGGFETGATFAANGWSEANPPAFTPSPFDYLNRWVTNTAAAGTGARAAYITNDTDGTPAIPPYAYSTASFVIPKIHRVVAFPAGETDITLSFDWKGEADSDDVLRVWLMPTGDAIPNAAYGVPSGVTPADTNLIGSYSGQTNWTNATITIPATYANNSSRLVFEWYSNATVGTTPAAIDNISLISEFVPVYCTPTSTNASDWIEDFSTTGGGPLEISNTNSGYTAPGYQDNTATQIVAQLPGATVDFTVQFDNSFNDPTETYGFNIWVDWNANGDFTDPGEKVYDSGIFVTGVTSDFIIPPTTAIGDYRMRIRSNYSNSNPNPCGSISYGEAEDYTVRVLDVSCTDDPSNITVSAIDYTTATITWDPATPSPGVGYEYFVTTNTDIPLYNQVPTGTTTSPTTTANLTGLIDGTIHYVWVRSVCSAGFGGTANWFGSVSFTTLVSPPTTTNISLCPGDTGPFYLTALSSDCTAPTPLGTQLTGALTAGTDPVAFRPNTGTYNTCSYYTNTSNYQGIDFVVDSDGIYTFEMDTPTPYFDGMGYIVLNDGNFTPGLCNGTWLQSNDDGGLGTNPRLTVTLTAGLSYTLYTTVWSSSNTTQSGSYLWNLSGPGSLIGAPAGSMDWYTTDSGGTPIFSGIDFDPVVDGPLTDTNTTGIYSFWAACSSSPSIRTQADFIIGKVWTGAIDSDWNTAGNWSPSGIPDDTDCVVVPNVANAPVINTGIDGLGNRLIVQSGGLLAQASNSSLTITDAVTVEAGGTYSIDDSASLVQINDVANTVNGTFQIARTATVRENDYVYWSSPVTAFNIENVSPGTPNGFKYEWVPTVTRPVIPPGPNDFGDWQAANTGAMSPGKGYAIKAPTGHGATPAPSTAVFSGTPNNGSISQTIQKGTFTGADYIHAPNGVNLTVTSDDDNWNFIGNPYPSALHLEDFLYHPAHSSFIDGTAYIWTHNTDIGTNGQSFYEDFGYSYSNADYLAVNATGNSLPTPYKGFVASGQGFFVLMTDFSANTTETVYFENYMRSAGNRNDQFYRSADTSTVENTEANTEDKHRIWLDFINPSGNTNTTLIGYIDGATNERDRSFDAKHTRGAGLNLYSMIEDDAYLIQGRQTPFVDTDRVPLGINVTEAGMQTIAINTLEGLFSNTEQHIYIEDATTGITHNLNSAPYLFTSEIGIINDRFILTYRASTLSVDDFELDNGIKVYEENETIVVTSTRETIASIEVYDMLGRTLFNKRSINSDRFTINDISPNNATLIVKVKLVNGQQKIAKMIF